MRTTQAEAPSSTKMNLKYRISKKEKSTEIIEPEGLKYLIQRGNEKRESMWQNKKSFKLNQEILLRNAQLHAESDLQKLQLQKLSNGRSEIAGSGSSRLQHQQRRRHHHRQCRPIQHVPYMHPTLSSDEIEACIPGKTFQRPNFSKRPSSPLLIPLSSSPKKGTLKMKISMKTRMIKAKSSHTVGKILRKIWSYIFEALSHNNTEF